MSDVSNPTEFPKAYDPKQWEEKLYSTWEESGFFNPDNLPGERAEAFSIIMPPPNANGRLHAGHGLDMTLKDIIIRFKRMQGYRALFLPGADHAGFETQIVYERALEKEGRSRFDMTSAELYENILAFTLENKRHMESDVRRMGASCDWSRALFTLDPKVISTVHQTFKQMFDDGLIYRGKRIVNWCSKHQTSLSEVETVFIEKNDPLYYFQYGPFVIGTARPETKFGDKYVVMHPDDERYKDYHDGQKLTLEWINGQIVATVIKDKAIDPEFGTGAMTITPWHDQTDFEIAERHGLEREPIIGFDGKLLSVAGEFSGLTIGEAREKIVAKLQDKGLLVKIDKNYKHSVKCCYKCYTPIEPQIKSQWFVKMKPLAEKAMAPVRDGRITFLPKRFEKIFFHWMENTIDWNISRQIVWGIPIPAKLCVPCDQGFPDLDDTLHTCPACQGKLIPDTDTFDTWFSSGQWPLLTLGYPDGPDFKHFYPTDLMETGADLVFKWVPRMIMFGMYLADTEPFKTVYFHGMVNDEHNQKMSKSKGNVISPVELSDRFGTDAMRMALVTGNGPGSNIPLSFQKVEAFRNFANKLWNVGRYVSTAIEEKYLVWDWRTNFPKLEDQSIDDQWIIGRLAKTKREVTGYLEKFNISLAAETLRDFTWNEFADWYVEIHKSKKHDAVLVSIWNELLILWHPFMPFVTEALFQSLYPNEKTFLMIKPWSRKDEQNQLIEEKNSVFEQIIKLIQKIRNVRATYHIDPKETLTLTLIGNETELATLAPIIQKLGRIDDVLLTDEAAQPSATASIVVGTLHGFVHLGDVIDIEKEKIRLTQEKEKLAGSIKAFEKRLQDEHFRSKAPAAIIAAQEKTLAENKTKLATLTESITALN